VALILPLCPGAFLSLLCTSHYLVTVFCTFQYTQMLPLSMSNRRS